MKIALSILAHDNQAILKEMVENIRKYCSHCNILLYNSGDNPDLGKDLKLDEITPVKKLCYTKITPYFIDLFEWVETNNYPYDYIINLETDALFIKHGFEEFLFSSMMNNDYMAPNFKKFTSHKSQWRPIKSLRPELPDWYKVFGFAHTNEGFNVGQIFSRNYIIKLLSNSSYPEIKRLVTQNASFTLHEVLFPTLVDFLRLDAVSYPDELKEVIRFRPYHGVASVKRALNLKNAFFMHPIRREMDDSAREYIRNLP